MPDGDSHSFHAPQPTSKKLAGLCVSNGKVHAEHGPQWLGLVCWGDRRGIRQQARCQCNLRVVPFPLQFSVGNSRRDSRGALFLCSTTWEPIRPKSPMPARTNNKTNG